MKDNLRPEDLVCRFGGEEFMIFLPDRDHDQGLQSAETIRTLIAEIAVMFGKQRIGVTVSIGGSFKSARKTIDVAIREADAALYRAKDEGRDQTVFVTPI
jgi:diguanylate cyclase (GGDEF)-like protein